jgi:hypothetical protein
MDGKPTIKTKVNSSKLVECQDSKDIREYGYNKQESSITFCELCETEARLHRLQCVVDKLLFCKEHGTGHLLRRPTHHFQEPNFEQGDECSEHKGEYYEFYCVQDQVPVCRVCDRLLHHEHAVIAVSQALENAKVEVEKVIRDLGSFRQDTHNNLQKIKQEDIQLTLRTSQLQNEMNKTFRELWNS